MPVKKVLNLLNCGPEWVQTQLFIDCSEEITQQLDVTYLLRKLMAVEAALSKLLERH